MRVNTVEHLSMCTGPSSRKCPSYLYLKMAFILLILHTFTAGKRVKA